MWWLKTRCRMGLVGCLIVLLASLPGRAEVKVDATCGVVLGEVETISSNLFGITAFEGFPGVVGDLDQRGSIAALRPGSIRFSGSIGWFAPGSYDPAWYDTPDAARQFRETLLHGSRYPYGRFFPVARQMGAEPMISLGSPPDYLKYEETGNPADFERWAEYCAAYIGLCKRFDPDLRLVQVWNEPNANWYNDPRAREKGSAELFIDMANKVAAAIKQRFPDVQVGGPTLCWPPAWPPGQEGHAPWYTWSGWTRPWLEGTKDKLDFFDFHDYYASPDELQVQVEMVCSEALAIQGRRLPIWITESNVRLQSPDDPAAMWQDRILPYQRWLLSGVLPQADKIAGNQYHDLSARQHRLGKSEHGPYWLLWVLRDLRGTRVAANSDDLALTTYATMEEDRVTVVLFNDSDQRKTVPLHVRMPCGWWTGPYVRAIGRGEAGHCTPLSIDAKIEHLHAYTARGTVDLPARATASISFRMDRFGKTSSRRVFREHFADRTLQFLKPGQPATLTIAVTREVSDEARLRIGLLGPEGDESLSARFNGHELRISAKVLQEIPLDEDSIRPTNQLEIHLGQGADNPRLAVGFASIMVVNEERDELR